MKLGKRQTQRLSDLLSEGHAEIDSAYQAKNRMRRQSYLNEAEVYSGLRSEDLDLALANELEQEMSDTASKCMSDFDKEVYKKLAKLLSDLGAEKMSGTVLRDDLEDFDSDGLMTLQQEFVSDVTRALEKYTSELALLASHAKLGPQ